MNDTDKFIKAFIRDREYFGENTAIGLYEDVYSFLLEKKVTGFRKISDAINEEENRIIDEMLNEEDDDLYENEDLMEGGIDASEVDPLLARIVDNFSGSEEMAKAAFAGSNPSIAKTLNKALDSKVLEKGFQSSALSSLPQPVPLTPENILKNAAKAEEALKGGNWFARVGNKIKSFFQGGTIKNLLTNGMAWVTNPANLWKVLGSAGGIVLLVLIIKSLAKRHQLKKYRNLQDFYTRMKEYEKNEKSNDKEIKECFEDNYAMDLVMEECKTNKRVRKLMFKSNPFDEFDKVKNFYLDY